MNALLEQFLSEARDFLQGIGEKLMQLEDDPANTELMTALFRMVHTLKGNSGLFEFPEMTRVLHAGEDLMDGVRNGRVAYSQELADRLLDAMDFVGILCDEIEASDGRVSATHAANSARLAESLRQLIGRVEAAAGAAPGASAPAPAPVADEFAEAPPLGDVPEAVRMAAYRGAAQGQALQWVDYAPAEECFFQGDDPFFQARGTPALLWGGVSARQPWPTLPDLDAYRCILDFHLLTTAPAEELDQHFRYMPDQIRRRAVLPLHLALPQGATESGPAHDAFVVAALALIEAGDLEGLRRSAAALQETASPELWLASALRWLLLLIEVEPDNRGALATLVESLRRMTPPLWDVPAAPAATPAGAAAPAPHACLSAVDHQVLRELLGVQRQILALPAAAGWHAGRVQSVTLALAGCLKASGDGAAVGALEAAGAQAIQASSAAPLLAWFDAHFADLAAAQPVVQTGSLPAARAEARAAAPAEGEPKFGRRAEDTIAGPKSLKVDQSKIDRLMNLIGEMVVSKNALPYLAARAESVFHVRELSREIKAQYAVINRIAEEMQDAIMQVRMMPVSFVFQRFPRLVRDTSNKLGKEVALVLEGEETEADKNIIESLGDPLVHIVRNSLDHGFESPEQRRAAGKPATGTLTIRASQEADRVVIEIRDDGKGIDPVAIKRKAYQKGLIDEAALERISDQEAINLVFASGFSTAEVVSDLSGRGVGMDVVRTAVEKVNGTVALESEKGRGTRIRLSLPLSMAVTNVMICESNGQAFGIPMDSVVETVRVPRSAMRTVKKSLATVLRGRVVPIKAINTLLGINAPPQANDEDELALLVVRLGEEYMGLLVDDFRETVDIILKPMTSLLAGLSAYSGSALMGDGSVLMVLNVKELM